jgi:hypothetical protein
MISETLATSMISAAALVLVAFLTFVLNSRSQDAAAWRKKKLEYYEAFFDALGQNVEGVDTEKSHRAFARETNNLLLVGSPLVLEALYEYRSHIRVGNPDRDYQLDKPLLANLVRAIRKDLAMPHAKKVAEKHMQLWSATLKRDEVITGP